MKLSTEIDNNFGYEKITQLVDNISLKYSILHIIHFISMLNKIATMKICEFNFMYIIS